MGIIPVAKKIFPSERAMSPNRRQFLSSAAAVGYGALCADFAAAAKLSARFAGPAAELAGKSLLGKMHWLNEPASVSASGDQVLVTTRPKTDYWRKTFYDYVTDNGHFFYLPVTGDFVLESRVAGKYAALYDQAGLMVRMDSSNWLKCGLELVDGIGHASVVLTREFSDWSTLFAGRPGLRCDFRPASPHTVVPATPATQARARSIRKVRSRVFCVSVAARSNSACASVKRPNLNRKSPRTLGSRW